MKTICKVLHGSRLYKLHNDKSDWDIKGIFIPDIEDCLLLRAPQNMNRKDEDTNTEYQNFALQTFLGHAAMGQSIALDMLHCSPEDCLESSLIWEYIVLNKSKFYTKKMLGALGFSKSLAMKYGFRAERMAVVELVLNALKEGRAKGASRMFDLWDDLPKGKYIDYDIDARMNQKDNRYIEVAGKKLQTTITVEYGIEILQKLYDGYGSRTQMAKNLGGADFKAISHSFRIAYQLKSIYTNGTFSYPLPETEFIKDIKYQKLNYLDDNLDHKLNDLITEVENLSKVSQFPKSVDQNWLDTFTLGNYNYKLS